MIPAPAFLRGSTSHTRLGGIRHGFSYAVDYVLIDPADHDGPALFSRNRFNLASVHDRNHGGLVGKGRGADWAREVFATAGLDKRRYDLRLLTQPAFLGYVFNPVSFWLALDGDTLRAVIAEVNNTFGDRHSYLCHRPGFQPIRAGDQLTAAKVFHVSPFQEIAGEYRFNFAVTPTRVAIRIEHSNGAEGVLATFTGRPEPLTNRALLFSLLARPFGAARTIALIYWQALRLKLKGAPYHRRPLPPSQEVSS